MIHFSFTSVLMTVVVSNLLLAAISMLFRNEDVLAGIGFKLTAVFCVITLMRFLFPFELPFAKTLIFPEFMSNGLSVLRHRHNVFPGVWISLWNVFGVVWLAGTICSLAILFYTHWKLRILVLPNSKDVTDQEPYATIIKEVCSERQRRKIRMRTTRFVNAPMIMGLRKAIILLPADIDTSDEDVMFALRHEVYHYVHHDLWLKFGVNCLVAVYWWNPFTHQLRRQISILLEMRVDDSIISEGTESTIGYITTMVHYMGGDPDRDDNSSQKTGLALKKKYNMSRRFRMIQSKEQKRNRLLSSAMLLFVVGMYIGSYLFIWENSTYGQEICESDAYITPRDEDCFAIRNEDGTYTVYIPTMGIDETVDSLEYYPKIKVYSTKEEYDKAIGKP